MKKSRMKFKIYVLWYACFIQVTHFLIFNGTSIVCHECSTAPLYFWCSSFVLPLTDITAIIDFFTFKYLKIFSIERHYGVNISKHLWRARNENILENFRCILFRMVQTFHEKKELNILFLITRRTGGESIINEAAVGACAWVPCLGQHTPHATLNSSTHLSPWIDIHTVTRIDY